MTYLWMKGMQREYSIVGCCKHLTLFCMFFIASGACSFHCLGFKGSLAGKRNCISYFEHCFDCQCDPTPIVNLLLGF